MIAGVYFVLSGAWSWNVVLAGIPYGLGVASINIAKHIDKHDDGKAKGVGTFPVRVGEAFARRVDQIAIILIYVVIAYLVFVPRYFTPAMLIVFLALKDAITAVKVLNNPKPHRLLLAGLPGLFGSLALPFNTTVSSADTFCSA